MPLDAAAEAAIRAALRTQGIPYDLNNALLRSVSDLVDHYVGDRLRPSELSGGDFVEASVRVLQHLAAGSHTPRDRSLPRFDSFLSQMEKSTLDDSLRVHTPRVLQVMYDVRNRRGVGHLPGPVSANRSDAELLMTCVKWILAEFIRLFHSTSHAEAQRLIDTLVRRELPIVQDFEGVLRVIVRRNLSLPDQLLCLLYAAEPSEPTRSQLADWTRAASSSLSTALSRLDSRNLVHRFNDGRAKLTALGQHDAEGILRSIQRERN